MDFRFTKEEEELQQRVRKLAQEKLAPIAPEADESDTLTPEVTEAMAKAGLFRYVIPKEYGGNGIRVTSACIIREELGKVSVQADSTFAMQGIGSYPITLAGTEEQKRKYLPRVASGEYIATFGLTEPHAGSDVANLKTTAVLDGNHYVLNGAKRFISQTGAADFYSIFAKTDPAAGTKGISVFIVDKGTPGFDTSLQEKVMAPHCIGAPRLTNCRVPRESLVGKPGEGMKIALSTLDVFRTTVGACALGIAEAAYQAALSYAKHRTAFGQPLAAFQATQFKLVDMATEIEAARYLVYYAAWLKDQGVQVITQASMAKLFATEMAQRVVDQALQIHGGQGVVRGTITERLYRAVRQPRIYEGASEVLKITVARQLLKEA